MPLYEIERRGRIRAMDDVRLRRRIARGRIPVDARVRAVGDRDWRAIRDVPELLEPLPPGASRGGETAWSLVSGLLANAGAFAVFGLWMLHGDPWVVAGWGFGLAMHALNVAGKLASARRARRALEGARAGQPAELGAGGPGRSGQEAAPGPRDPFLAELEAAVASLEAAARPSGLPRSVDLGALRTTAAELRRQHLALEVLADGAARERLSREREEAEAGASRSSDPRTAEVLRAQARSVEARLAALEQAAGASARLAARERTLLHQIEALRLALLQTGLDEERAPDLAGEVERLQLDLRANAEIEADLARARLGARLQRT